MTAIRDRIRDHALDGIALNQRQATLIANPTVEIDSLLEVFTGLIPTSTPRQRPLIRQGLGILRNIAQANSTEGDHLRVVAGAADQLPAIGPGAPLSARRAARELRDPLANLVNPIITGGRHEAALAAVLDVVARSTRKNVLSVTVRHELGVNRYTLLTEIVNAPVTA